MLSKTCQQQTDRKAIGVRRKAWGKKPQKQEAKDKVKGYET